MKNRTIALILALALAAGLLAGCSAGTDSGAGQGIGNVKTTPAAPAAPTTAAPADKAVTLSFIRIGNDAAEGDYWKDVIARFTAANEGVVINYDDAAIGEATRFPTRAARLRPAPGALPVRCPPSPPAPGGRCLDDPCSIWGLPKHSLQPKPVTV